MVNVVDVDIVGVTKLHVYAHPSLFMYYKSHRTGTCVHVSVRWGRVYCIPINCNDVIEYTL